MALRARSLKGIICGMRNNSIVNKADAFSLSRRVSANLKQYVWNIGSIRLPQAPVVLKPGAEGMVQAYAELVKMFSSFNSLDYAGRVEMDQYFDAGFALGIDTEAYSQDTSLLESGMDTSSQSLPVRLELTFGAGNTVRTTGGNGGYAKAATLPIWRRRRAVQTFTAWSMSFTVLLLMVRRIRRQNCCILECTVPYIYSRTTQAS